MKMTKLEWFVPACIGAGALVFLGFVSFIITISEKQQAEQEANREVITTKALDSSLRSEEGGGLFGGSSGTTIIVLVKIDNRFVSLSTSQLVRKGDTILLTERLGSSSWRRYTPYGWTITILERANG